MKNMWKILVLVLMMTVIMSLIMTMKFKLKEEKTEKQDCHVDMELLKESKVTGCFQGINFNVGEYICFWFALELFRFMA